MRPRRFALNDVALLPCALAGVLAWLGQARLVVFVCAVYVAALSFLLLIHRGRDCAASC